MFRDEMVSMSYLSNVVQNFNDVGLNSVARHIKLPAGAVSKLNERELLQVLLQEIEKKGEEKVLVRHYGDYAIGIPVGVDAGRLNRFFQDHEIEIPGTCTCHYVEKLYDEEVSIVGDNYKVGLSQCHTMLDGKIHVLFTLKPVIEAFEIKLRIKPFMLSIPHKKIDDYAKLICEFEERQNGLLTHLNKVITRMKNQQVNIDILLLAKSLAKTIECETLAGQTKRLTESLLDKYPMPIKNTKNVGKQPKLWKESTKIEDLLHFDYFFDTIKIMYTSDQGISSDGTTLDLTSKLLLRVDSQITKVMTYSPIEIPHLENYKNGR